MHVSRLSSLRQDEVATAKAAAVERHALASAFALPKRCAQMQTSGSSKDYCARLWHNLR